MRHPLMFSVITLLLSSTATLATDLSDTLTLKGKGELVYSTTEAAQGGMRPWYDAGAGQLALRRSKLSLGPQSLALEWAPLDHWSATVQGQYHHLSATGVDLTEAWLTWQPLPLSGYKTKLRAGWFYPALSLENTDPVWTSPYSSSFSLINSWFAEELRANALELSISRPGRAFDSQLSLQLVGALARGNDPIGSVISWRGFALHNVQTGLNERFAFAAYPSLKQPPLTKQPNWVEPFEELDSTSGYYVGLHALWRDSSELRLYRYDNKADPTVFAKGQYAWKTRFDHLALQQQLGESVRVVAQVLQGDTEMGWQTVVVDYQAWFVLLNYSTDDWQWTVRFDRAKQTDRDETVFDNNNGRSRAWTANVSYNLGDFWQLGAEFTELHSVQPNRAQWANWPVEHTEQVARLLLTWRIH